FSKYRFFDFSNFGPSESVFDRFVVVDFSAAVYVIIVGERERERREKLHAVVCLPLPPTRTFLLRMRQSRLWDAFYCYDFASSLCRSFALPVFSLKYPPCRSL